MKNNKNKEKLRLNSSKVRYNRSLASGMMSIPDEEFIEKELSKYQSKFLKGKI